MITDTATNERRAFCRAVQPEPKDPLAEVVRILAGQGRARHSVAFALVNALGICRDIDEADAIVQRLYPWP